MTWVDHRAIPLEVRYDWHEGRWRVYGPEGDYGLVKSQTEAICIAVDASVTGGPAIGDRFRRIHVYDRDHLRLYTIVRVKGKLNRASAQFFQDDVE